MNTVITINGNTNPDENYVTWSPAPARIQLMNPGATVNPVRVRLKNKHSAIGRQLSFFLARDNDALDELDLDLPTDGSPVAFFVAGKFDENNLTDYAAEIEAIKIDDGNTLSTARAFVRVRRNANTLSEAEQDLFLSAIARLNNSGNGLYEQFRDMHVKNSLSEAHGFSGFLPWHRAYLLHLERALQEIEPRVALHYWKFDEAAPKIFSKEFMGVSDQNGTVEFVSGHPFENWVTDGVPGIVRTPLFNVQEGPASNILGPVISELATLAKGGQNQVYRMFQSIEFQPHNRAHSCFGGMISKPDTAPKDPLFFLLHSNVDRLWALWQVLNERFDVGSSDTYTTNGRPKRNPDNIGHNLNNTMWPWNLAVAPPRPSTAPVPGGSFAASPIVTAPGLTPKISDMIDYQGVISMASCLGFDYDVVPFG